MKCSKCGFENKNKAKFCAKCGNSLSSSKKTGTTTKSNNSRYLIIILVVIIIILLVGIGYFATHSTSNGNDNVLQSNATPVDSDVEVNQENSNVEKNTTSEVSTTQIIESKSWVSIGSYSGSGSGSKTISVPEGKIMVKLSAYPVKNYADNHLYVTGSNGKTGGVDWGSKSAVETRSDSFKYTSSSEETFTIDYYETVSWEVEFFRWE